ncbi:helix-turn-helix transcriptional regulator [Diaphorobacter nitroreducens]|uniref:helix-turn-helix transcriptional regulator n=1 Tax=Diaphorobacter nitroreducens TaxID=164759 RepID=UPI002899596F|nr:helix-turn-helix domain-containing protein [Diaphorobacter nitroreducens]
MQQLLVSPTELSRLLGLAPQTIYNRLSIGGDLPAVIRIGRLPRFAIADVHAWLDTKRAAATRKHQLTSAPRRPGRPTKAEQIARRQSTGQLPNPLAR